jgi:hypothetical protein
VLQVLGCGSVPVWTPEGGEERPGGGHLFLLVGRQSWLVQLGPLIPRPLEQLLAVEEVQHVVLLLLGRVLGLVGSKCAGDPPLVVAAVGQSVALE